MFKSNLNSIKFASLLCYLLPLALLSGPFLPDLIISLVSIIFIYISIREKLIKFYKSYFFIIFSIFYFYILISSLNSEFYFHSLESSFFYFRFGFFALAIWFLIERNNNFLKNFTIIFSLTFILAIIDSYYQFYNDTNMFGIYTLQSNRLTLLFNDKTYLGGYLSRLTPLLIGLVILISNNKKISYLLISICLILVDVSVYLSGERTAIGLLLVGSLFIILLMREFRMIRVVSLTLSIIIIVIISIANPIIKERNIDKTINQVFNQKQGEIAIFSITHESHFITAYKMFKAKPILGHGPNTFRVVCSESLYEYNDLSCSTHPHNIYIQILAETGLIGILIFLIIPASLLYITLLHIKSYFLLGNKILNDAQICFLGAILLTLFPFFPTQNFFNNYINIIFYLPVGFFLHSMHQKNNNSSK